MKQAKTGRGESAAGAQGRDRKAEHIELALDRRMQLERNFFEDHRFEHQALPEIAIDEVDTSTEFLDNPLSAPLVISCMTGGTDEAHRINLNLAAAAEKTRVVFGVGSQRKAIEDDTKAGSFQVRHVAPSIPVLANLGAVQLNYGFGIEQCREAVRMVEADALVFHVNALQEAIQPEGQCDFSGLLSKIERIAAQLEVPVIVKEIGCGISAATARTLVERGVRIVDTAGLGGTSWARIEGERASDVELGEMFANWGIPTTESIRQVRQVPGLTVIGSGGVRNGIDMAKAIALGADLVGMAYPFLQAAAESEEAVVRKIRRTVLELKICMFCVGARTIGELQNVPLHRRAREA